MPNTFIRFPLSDTSYKLYVVVYNSLYQALAIAGLDLINARKQGYGDLTMA